MTEPSLQERFAPDLACFGCGPANPQGLGIRSFVEGERVVCDWTPSPHHQAYPGLLNGGIVGALLDCHANWTAAWHLMVAAGDERPPCTVTAEYTVQLRRPTPTDGSLHLDARVTAVEGRRVTVAASLSAVGEVTATCTGLFVAVEEGHPAWHRW